MFNQADTLDNNRQFEGLKDKFLWLITPPGIEKSNQYLRVQLLLAMLLCFSVTSILPISLIILNGASPIYFVPSFASILTYFTGRFYNYQLAGHLLIITATLSPFIVMLSSIFEIDAGVYLLLFFNMSLIASLMANLIYSVRTTMFVITINISIFLSVLFTTHLELPPNSSSIPIMIDVILIGILIMINAIASQNERIRLHETANAFQENRRRIEDLMNHSSDLIAIRAGGQYLYINQEGAKLLGIEDVSTILNKPCPDFEIHEDVNSSNVQLKQMKNDRMSIRYRGRFRHVDGSILEADVVNTVIAYSGEIANMLFARPIYSEETDTASFQPPVSSIVGEMSHEESREVLLKSVLRQAIVAELGVMALSVSDATHLFENVALLVGQGLNLSFCGIYRADPANHCFTLETSTRLPALQTISSENIIFEQALHQQDTILIDGETAIAPPEYLAQSLKQGICLPLIPASHTYGVLVAMDNDHRFDDEEIYFMQSIANLLSSFLATQYAQASAHSQRRYAEIMRDATTALNQNLDLDAILITMLHYIRQLIPAYEKSLLLIMDEHGELRLGAVNGTKDDVRARAIFEKNDLKTAPLVARVLATMQPINIQHIMMPSGYPVPAWIDEIGEDYPQSFIGAPILLAEQCLGVLMVYATRPNAFKAEDLDHLAQFASKAAVALQNARLKTELEARVQERTLQFKQERQQLQAILDATGEGIIYSEDSLILFANKAMSKLLGYAQHDFIGQPLTMLLPKRAIAEVPHLSPSYWFANSNEKEQTWQENVTLSHTDGRLVDVEMTFSLLNNDDLTSSTVIIMRDISAQKVLEAQKSRFISTAAHELRSPITTLNTRLYLMKRKPEEIQNVHLPILEKSVNRINRLVADLLDLSSFEHGQMQIQRKTTILQDVLSDIYEMENIRAESNGVTLRLDFPAEPIALIGDPDRLYQVFTNLLVNAIHYTPEGGRVTLRLQLSDDAKVVCVEIEDSGQGISPEDIEQIFVPFFRANEKKVGTGLGLSIAHEIVHLHGGSIEVKSELGQGSTFRVSLPAMG